MSGNGPRFALVEREDYRERELYEGDDLEEVAEYLERKTGELDLSLPEVKL